MNQLRILLNAVHHPSEGESQLLELSPHWTSVLESLFPAWLERSMSQLLGNCNIPSFQKSEKSEKFKTFSNYMYFALKRNFMHGMHHHLVLFAFVCIWLFKRLEYNFPIKNLFDQILFGFYIIPNIIFCCLPSLI